MAIITGNPRVTITEVIADKITRAVSVVAVKVLLLIHVEKLKVEGLLG